MLFKVDVYKTTVYVREREVVTSGSKKAYYVSFEFKDSLWDSLNKTAVFKHRDVVKDIILREPFVTQIPWECMQYPNEELLIGVFGKSNGEIVIPTIWDRLTTVLQGTTHGEETLNPTPTVYEQLLSQIGNLDNLTTEAKKNLVDAINEVNSKAGAGGGSGESGTIDHSKLINRDIPEQHPISAITNLAKELDSKFQESDLGTNLQVTIDGKLSVKMASEVEKDNTLPASSALVYTQIGNINALLESI